MIIDSLANSDLYLGTHPLFPAAFEYLRNFDPSTPDGKYELDGKRLYALVQRYETAPEALRSWEAHRVYADIQYIVSGREKIGYSPVQELDITAPYDETKDIEKYTGEKAKSASTDVLYPGQWAVYFPQDAHRPGIAVDQPEQVVKVVIKIRLKD